jgi:hypothetical protein
LDFIFVAAVLFVLLVLAMRTRRLLKRLEKEVPKELRNAIVIKRCLSENDASQSVDVPAPAAV